MPIKCALPWPPDALFAGERKGVARVEREGGRDTAAAPVTGPASFRGKTVVSAMEGGKKRHSFMWAVDSLQIRFAWRPPPPRKRGPQPSARLPLTSTAAAPFFFSHAGPDPARSRAEPGLLSRSLPARARSVTRRWGSAPGGPRWPARSRSTPATAPSGSPGS